MPRYPVPWIATYFITAGILIAGAFAAGWYMSGLAPQFDYANPDIEFLERIVQSANPRRGDFARLNAGDWSLLCLAGPRAAPAALLDEARAAGGSAEAVGEALEKRPPELHASEFVLVYVTGRGEVRIVPHPHGFAFARGDAVKCIMSGRPVLELPVGF